MKTKLDVVRINEDVISTSTCQHKDCEHYFYTANSNDYIYYEYCDTHHQWEYSEETWNGQGQSDWYELSGWYVYYDKSDIQCSGDHSFLNSAVKRSDYH